MIGKIIAVAIFGLMLIAVTGDNVTKYYQDLAVSKNKVQPLADNFINKPMINASHFNLRNEIFQILGQD